ncbi:MAG: GDSL-type esterase/lipase family protein [Lachnospiraceae bacterium]|nr:GDSL-type esterase/lipase family protein [Lachnospiraceae bacterium]
MRDGFENRRRQQHKNKTIWHTCRNYFAIGLLFLGITGISNIVHAETKALPVYITAMEQKVVYVGPGKEYNPIGYQEKDKIAIVYALTENQWYQIYYKGTVGYISPEHVKLYTGGDGSITAAPWKLQGIPIVMNALGDSITEGEKLSSQKQTYANLLADKMGAVVINNYGLGGSCLAGIHPDRLLDRYTQMAPNANLILIMAGTNDYGFDTALGVMGDRTQETFYGGLNLLMCGLQQMYPNAEIVFATPLKREKGTKPNKYGNTLEQYAQAVISMANFYNMRVIDVYSPASLNFAGQKSTYMADGIHPNAKAHAILADYMYRHLTIING